MLRHFMLQCIAVVALVQLSAWGALECRDDLLDADGYTIRSVKVEGRWVPSIALPIKPGDRFSNAKIQQALRAVQEALHGEERGDFELQSLGAVGVIHITRCLLVEGREVDVIIQARSLRFDLYQVGENVLPIPRSALATFYDAVPAPLLAFNPTFGAYQDERYGFAPTFGIATDLLALPQTLRSQAATERRARLELIAAGRKSVEESFYDANVQLALTSLRPGEFLEQSAFEFAYIGTEEPQGDNTFARQAGEVGGSLRLKPKLGLVQTLSIGAKYRWSHNRFAPDGDRADTDENAGVLRVIAEGRAGGGFLRAGLWADGGSPASGSDYGRIAGLIGFEKEFLVAPNQTIGVEAIVGGGKAWSAPSYARFYGGNSERDFLYDGLQSPALVAFPRGPVIRSLGEGETLDRSGRGGSDYWHVNLNISFPIPGLSAPLIPNEEVAPGLTLKRLLKNKAGDSVSHLAVEFEDEGLSPAAALAKAKAIYGEVQPAIEFVADRANVYALKPLLLCDVAGQSDNGRRGRVDAALGGGLQLTIVTAKMEIGYMHTVAGDSERSGNFFGRIVFENLF